MSLATKKMFAEFIFSLLHIVKRSFLNVHTVSVLTVLYCHPSHLRNIQWLKYDDGWLCSSRLPGDCEVECFVSRVRSASHAFLPPL